MPHRYVTEYTKPDGLYGGHVDANSWEEAQSLCDDRGFGETVVGVLYLIVGAEGIGPEGASELMKGLADSYGPPPDSSEFEGSCDADDDC